MPRRNGNAPTCLRYGRLQTANESRTIDDTASPGPRRVRTDVEQNGWGRHSRLRGRPEQRNGVLRGMRVDGLSPLQPPVYLLAILVTEKKMLFHSQEESW